MNSVLLVVHILLAISLIIVVLLQRPQSGDLGSLGGGGNTGAIAPMASANPLSSLTMYLAGGFMLTSLALAFIASHHGSGHSLLDKLQAETAAKGAMPGAPSLTTPPATTPDATQTAISPGTAATPAAPPVTAAPATPDKPAETKPAPPPTPAVPAQ